MVGIKHPARHFLYYLLSRRIYDVKAIVRLLQEHELPVPQHHDGAFDVLVHEIMAAKRAMVFPPRFDPRAGVPDPETAAFLNDWRIRDVWRGSEYVTAATELLGEPHIRYMLELMLLGPLSAQAIAKRIAERYGLPSHLMNAAVVRAFAHYYWDVMALDPGQWRRFLSSHYASTAHEYYAAYMAPRDSTGAAFVIAASDRDFKSLPPSDRYQTASVLGFSMMMRHALADDLTTGRTYAAFTALNMMRAADEELERYRGGSADLLRELGRIHTIYDEKTPLQITQAAYVQRPVIDVESNDDEP